MNKKIFIKITSLVLTTTLLFSASYFKSSARDFKAEIDAIEKKIDANNKKAESNEATLDDIQEKHDLIQQQIQLLDEQISSLQGEIGETNKQIDIYNAEIASLDAEIESTNKQIEEIQSKVNETYDVLKQRMRASYMSGQTSTLEILLGSSDFESLLTRMQLLKSVSDHDNAVMQSLRDDISRLNSMLDDINKKKEDVAQKKADVEVKKSEIQSKLDQINESKSEETQKRKDNEANQQKIVNFLGRLDRENAEWQAAIAKIQAAEEEYNRAQSASLSKGGGTIENKDQPIGNYVVSSKGMILPLQYSNTVASAWWGSYSGHKGLDLITSGGTGNTYGKEIRAAASGKVVFAGKGSNSSWSYGNFVTIDHGNGVSTRYAHCSSVAVSSGQTVSQGQVIAYVGNSGNVYPAPSAANPHAGAHVHFEVIVNGTRVNPEPWVPSVRHN